MPLSVGDDVHPAEALRHGCRCGVIDVRQRPVIKVYVAINVQFGRNGSRRSGGPVDGSDGFDGYYARPEEATESPRSPPRIAPDQGLLQMGQPPPVQPST
jgi:hypothetical protein